MKELDEHRFIINVKSEYPPSIGRLLSMMDYTRKTTLDAVEGLSVEELDYRINGKGNSIGCLLYHIVCVEEVYQILTFEGREPTKDERQKLDVGLKLGEKSHEEIIGKGIDYYKEKLILVRKRTLELFKNKEDNWLDEVSPFVHDYDANHYFRWFHVFEDELNHRGQIRLIRNHMNRE
ncbi:DinB family protein [Halobacillus sp. A5]|uniref:DinB family protein n=1 Tax=Halobacillus sp. A5 TaxID=2880263 RepID=UPI0020A6BB1F|nr:DinB family protein [Halobacillus sp. A5]MCP3027710.1 DinB family protein [Halobacillus sp. A5]